MNARRFFEAVASMRRAQRAYQRTRSAEDRRHALRWEQEVDGEIRRVREIEGGSNDNGLF